MPATRILLADDNDEILAEVREELKKEGFEIIGTATNGQDAVESVRLFDPDVIFSRFKKTTNIFLQRSLPVPPAMSQSEDS